MTTEIKLAQSPEDITIYKAMTNYAFGPSPNRSAQDEPQLDDPDIWYESYRYLLYEDDKPVSSLHSIPMTENIRGKVFPMQGIAGVSTYPEARRKGHINKLMDHTFLKGKQDGQIFTTLYPFRQSFYGRFGYIVLPQARFASFSPAHLRDISHYIVEGEVERHLIGDVLDRYIDFMKRMEQVTHGFSLFPPSVEQRLLKSMWWVIFAVIDGQDRGMMCFTTKGFEKELELNHFMYLDSTAKYVLLDHLSRHVDQFSQVNMRILPSDRPETWFYDGRIEVKSREWVPSAMGRVLDVSQIGGMNVGSGSISFILTDDHCDWNNGVWTLTSIDGKLEVSKGGDPWFDLTIQGLSAIIYGGHQLDDLVIRGWLSSSDHNEAILQLFPEVVASLFTMF